MACDSQGKGFEYKRVSQQRHEIRIIILLPGEFEENIACGVEHVSFDDTPVYEALSYTWGERTDKVQITLGGAPFLITHNLALALRHLRLRNDARKLWVDAICINQRDTLERNNQVQQMARIYQMAEHVHVWLGPENDTSKTAMKFLKEVNEKVLTSIDSESRLENLHKWIKGVYEDPKYEKTWEAITRLWQRGYWSRIWIIQEVVFGTSNRLQCFVHCGKDCIAWETLVAVNCAMSLIDRKCYDNEHSDVDIVQFSKSARLDLSWFIVAHGCRARNKELLLSYLLVRQGRYQATDARDKVYALLSMVHESQTDGLIVDYGLSTAEVYTMAMKEMVTREKKLGLLCACCRECRNRDPLGQLPSWCPDFGTDPMDKCCPARLWSYTKPVYYASGDLNAEAGFPQKAGTPVLSAYGWRLDTINVRPHGVEYGKEDFPSQESLLFLAQGIDDGTPESLEYISGTAHEAIWRTLVANRGYSHDKAPEVFGQIYMALITKYIAASQSSALDKPDSNLNVSDQSKYTRAEKTALRRTRLGKKRKDNWDKPLQNPSKLQKKEKAKKAKTTAVEVDLTNHIEEAEDIPSVVDQDSAAFREKMNTCLRKRHLCKSDKRALPGLVPNTAIDGDIACILIGCALPIILRKVEDHYIVIGESYIHGFMYGEILDLVKAELLEQEEFLIH